MSEWTAGAPSVCRESQVTSIYVIYSNFFFTVCRVCLNIHSNIFQFEQALLPEPVSSPVPHTSSTDNGIGLDGESNSVIAKKGLYRPPTRIPQTQP